MKQKMKKQSTYSSLKESVKIDIVNKIIKLMKDEKLYLQYDLTLEKLAVILKKNKIYISQSLNKKLKKNFTRFINEYRIEEAMKLLKNREYNIYTMEYIANKVGFRSANTFFRAFKKFTGKTPLNFQKHAQENLND